MGKAKLMVDKMAARKNFWMTLDRTGMLANGDEENNSDDSDAINRTLDNFPNPNTHENEGKKAESFLHSTSTNRSTNPFCNVNTKETEYKHSNDLQSIDVINLSQALMSSFKEVVDSFKSKESASSRFLITFSGRYYEDPIEFIRSINQHFHDQKIYQDLQKVEVMVEHLTGDAKRWVEPYKFLNLNYDQLVDRFLNQYDNEQNRAKNISRLYGEKQEINEAVDLFIAKKAALFQRLMPGTPERVQTSIILNLLLPEIRVNLRNVSDMVNLKDLTRVAGQVESDMAETKKVTNRSTTSTNNIPHPCRFCGDNHFHRDCPRNPYVTGNRQRAVSGNQSSQQTPAQQRQNRQ